jgi:hypothetical protein
LLEDLALELETGGALFAETGGDDDGAFDAGIGALADDLGDGGGGCDDDGEVYVFGDGFDVGIGFDAEDVGAFWVDGEDGSAEGAGDEVPEECATDAVGVFGCADDGDGARGEDGVEGVAGGLGCILVGVHFGSYYGSSTKFVDRFSLG